MEEVCTSDPMIKVLCYIVSKTISASCHLEPTYMCPLYSLLSLTSISTTLALAYTIGCSLLLLLFFIFSDSPDKKFSSRSSYTGADYISDSSWLSAWDTTC